MPNQLSIDSIEYAAEKFSECRYLSDESLAYLTQQTSAIIGTLLQDASKFLRRCHRTVMIAEDFQFALKLHHVEPVFGGCTSSSAHRAVFRKIRKDNRTLHQIDDHIVELNELMACRPKIPLDISLRTHWLAIDGQQPTISENPIIQDSIPSKSSSASHKKRHGSYQRSQILSQEQEIYYKQITELCICPNDHRRKQALLILSSDSCLQQIVGQLVLFISEGVRVNITGKFDRSVILKHLMEMSYALLRNENLCCQRYLHYLLPAILSCLLEQGSTAEHWSRRDLAAKCSVQILQRYSTAVNRLQQRTIDIFYRILIDDHEQYTWSTRYGALIGLCEMGNQVIIEIVFPRLKQLGEHLQYLIDKDISQQFSETVVKFITIAYRSVRTDPGTNEKKLQKDFGSYFAPLIQHQLILLL